MPLAAQHALLALTLSLMVSRATRVSCLGIGGIGPAWAAAAAGAGAFSPPPPPFADRASSDDDGRTLLRPWRTAVMIGKLHFANPPREPSPDDDFAAPALLLEVLPPERSKHLQKKKQ